MTPRITLGDLPLSRLRRILRDTERLLGPTSTTAEVIRRAIRAKQKARERRVPEGGPYAA
jgi:hypothetical protein